VVKTVYVIYLGLSCTFIEAFILGATLLAVLFGLTGCGVLLLRVCGWQFDHKNGTARTLGGAGVLLGFAFVFAALIIVWIIRIHHLFRWLGR
jgi:hypothetical protein